MRIMTPFQFSSPIRVQLHAVTHSLKTEAVSVAYTGIKSTKKTYVRMFPAVGSFTVGHVSTLRGPTIEKVFLIFASAPYHPISVYVCACVCVMV